MTVYRRGKRYWMDTVIDGERHRVPLETTNWQEARRKAAALVSAITEGKAGSQGRSARETFNGAADAYLDERQLHSAEKTFKTDGERSRVLRKYFGEIRLRRITAEMIVSYQKKRKEQGVAGLAVIQRFNAEPISDKIHRRGTSIIEGKSEHAAAALQTLDTPGFIRAE